MVGKLHSVQPTNQMHGFFHVPGHYSGPECVVHIALPFMNKILSLFILAATFMVAACTDPTVIGGDLLEGNQLPVNYRDDISVKLTTQRAENNSLSTGVQDTEEGVAFGCIKSPYTGDLNSRIGMQIVERGSPLDLSLATVDSIVLVLPMDPIFQLGDTSATTSIQITGAIAGSIDTLEPQTFSRLNSNGIVYGETTMVPPRGTTTATVFDGDSIRVDTFGPEMRIALNQNFRDELLPALQASVDRGSVVNDSLFLLDFPGIIIEGSDCGATLPAINLSLARINRMGVFVYYTTDSLQKRQYQLNYRRGATSVGVLRPEYVHTFTGSPAGALLDGAPFADSIAIVQSLSGLMVKVEFPDLSPLDNAIVNAAFLEIPVVQGTRNDIRALPRILVRRPNSDGDLVDYSAGSPNAPAPFTLGEGGSILKIPDPRGNSTDSISAYRFNLTTIFQDFITNSPLDSLFLVARFQTQLPGESILVGPSSDTTALRARLLLATTELP